MTRRDWIAGLLLLGLAWPAMTLAVEQDPEVRRLVEQYERQTAPAKPRPKPAAPKRHRPAPEPVHQKAPSVPKVRPRPAVDPEPVVEPVRGDNIAQGMVVIPGGSFQMGCSPGDSQCFDNEKPVHQVKVASFRMGKFEVTQAQWQAVMNANPARFKGDQRPVENVSWDDIQTFLGRLNAKGSGKPYRLPTEAEWEYAARAGGKTPYWWGREIGQNKANCCDGSGKETAPVGSFKPNAFGLYDTVGNVWEWVQDCGHENYTGAPADGSEWRGNNCTGGRVFRGGSWDSGPRYARVSGRDGSGSVNRYGPYGLRLAQDL